MDAHGYAVSMLENPKLFQLFELLGRSRLESGIYRQKLSAIDIKAHMPESIPVSGIISIEGDAGTREVHGSIGVIQNNFHDIGVAGIIRWAQGSCDCPNLAVRRIFKSRDSSFNDVWGDLRLVRLDIHDKVSVHGIHHFRYSAGSIGVFAAGSAGLESMISGSLKNGIGITGDEYPLQAIAGRRRLGHMDDQRQTGFVRECLGGETHGFQTSRNDADHTRHESGDLTAELVDFLAAITNVAIADVLPRDP